MKSGNLSRVSLCVLLCLLLASPLLAQQTTVTVHEAVMSVPFGEVKGVLVQVDDYLVFVDEGQPQNSFAVRRAHVRNLSGQEGIVTMELAQPVTGRSGQLDRLSFRLQDRANVAGLTGWGGSSTGQQTGNMPASGTPNVSDGITASYQVKHNHTFGDCRGNLIIRQNGLAYESISEINHSRQWAFRDVREIDRDNPYEMTVKPFTGDDYDFDFLGKGMDNNVYRTLTERVTAARVAE